MALSLNNGVFLVVDDDPIQQSLIATQLGHLGAGQVRVASGGGEAIQLLEARTDPFDLLLVDLQMPGMDGIEFIRHLAELDYPGPLLLVSGEDRAILETAQGVARSHKLHLLGALTKPVPLQSLSDYLDRLGKSSPAADLCTSGFSISPVDLRMAIIAGELALYFQPKVAMSDRRLVGAEALPCWDHPEHGKIFSDQFMPLAEKFGLAETLTDETIQQAFARFQTWRENGLDLASLSVNLSIHNLYQPDYPDLLREQSRHYAIEPDRILLEMTERCLTDDSPLALENLARLRLAGFKLSLEGYGRGCVSLEQLDQVPFNELKFDRHFVQGIGRDSKRHAILEASVAMAEKLGLSTVVEGVACADEWDILAGLGCELAQGDVISGPLSAEAFEAWALTYASD